MKRGAVAQLGEHLVCNQGVVGSIPISSTRDSPKVRRLGELARWWYGVPGCAVARRSQQRIPVILKSMFIDN